jgi:spore maturation protein CgeB
LTAGKEVEIFKSVQDAAALVKKYLADEKGRLRIAEAGRNRVMREHTFDSRAHKLMAFIDS